MTTTHAPVGIVGAGPVGLVAALRLASFGIRSVVLEARPELFKQGSKACLIQGDVLEVLDKVGCADQVAAEGVTWHVARTYIRGKQIRETVYPPRLGFGPFVNISQYRVEQILLARLLTEPLCEVRWAHRVSDLTQDADGVTVQAVTPEGTRELRFAHLMACDGIHSELRAMAGVNWTGYSHSDRFLITDIRAALPLAQERHFHYDPPFNPGRQLVIHPQPDSVWRIDWQLPPDADIEAERRTGQLDQRIRAVIGDIPYEIDWLSTYRFHQRVADRLRVGRILFAGDAAHALPPYGSRGMNSGIQDADNAAWKLALVAAGAAGETLLDTYHQERHAAANENLRVTEATIQFMVPPSRLRRWIRNAILRLAAPVKSMRGHVNSGRMAEPYVYRDSPIVDNSPLAGVFAPDGLVVVAGRPTRLRRLFGAEFVGLYVGADPAQAARFVADARRDDSEIPARLVLVLPPGTPAGELSHLATVAHDTEPGLRAAYGGGQATWYLVRPDGHIAGAYGPERAADFAEILRRGAGSAAQPELVPIPAKEAS
ncbi:FAD-dependent oxidoreductase [Acrocarpospora macrocephala]|uniref:FAD-dependent oxidoreductase n=1 Tax=Acrocarpospora macrocephala TaxID=150177 RepID=A0A5M3WVR9_9ACTN|nr:FAD-dependent monooxygenase [Acrocarpospora macrocephala]GES12820.1 FAD-dependent oxidoreductase [Acrocarpospora macrocephala]